MGGSGSGKTWLACRLQKVLPGVTRFSLDDFYKDRSHLSPARRNALNFDRPDAIDWATLEVVLKDLLNGRPACAPRYNFKTHTRLRRSRMLEPRPIILVEGLWLLRRISIRRLFSFRIFLQCSARIRLQRRIERDLSFRARNRGSVLGQFWQTVEPMHKKFVAAQIRRADLVLRSAVRSSDVKKIASMIRERLGAVR